MHCAVARLHRGALRVVSTANLGLASSACARAISAIRPPRPPRVKRTRMDSKHSCAPRAMYLTASAQYRSDFAQADTVSDLVDVELSDCARFVDSLGLPLLKAKKLLAALRGAAHAEVYTPCAPRHPRPVRGVQTERSAVRAGWCSISRSACRRACRPWQAAYHTAHRHQYSLPAEPAHS